MSTTNHGAQGRLRAARLLVAPLEGYLGDLAEVFGAIADLAETEPAGAVRKARETLEALLFSIDTPFSPPALPPGLASQVQAFSDRHELAERVAMAARFVAAAGDQGGRETAAGVVESLAEVLRWYVQEYLFDGDWADDETPPVLLGGDPRAQLDGTPWAPSAPSVEVLLPKEHKARFVELADWVEERLMRDFRAVRRDARRVTTVLGELVSNGFRHGLGAREDGAVSVHLTALPGVCVVTVRDGGRGFLLDNHLMTAAASGDVMLHGLGIVKRESISLTQHEPDAVTAKVAYGQRLERGGVLYDTGGFRVLKRVKDDRTLLRFSGVLDEDVDLTLLLPLTSGEVYLDLEGVRQLTSAGVRHWTEFFRERAGGEQPPRTPGKGGRETGVRRREPNAESGRLLRYVRLSVPVVEVACMHPGFIVTPGWVDSFSLPFETADGEDIFEALVTPLDCYPGGFDSPALPPTRPEPSTGEHVILPEENMALLKFLETVLAENRAPAEPLDENLLAD